MHDYRCPSCERKGEDGRNLSFVQFCGAYGFGQGVHFFCNDCRGLCSLRNKEYQGNIFKSDKIFKLTQIFKERYPSLLTETCCAFK